MSDIPPRSVGRSIRPVPTLLEFSYLGRLPVVNRGMLACHRSAPEEKPEATIGKWGDWNYHLGAASRRGQGDCLNVGHSVCPTSVCLGILFSDSPPIRPWTYVTPVSVVPVSVTISQSIYYLIHLSFFTLLFSISITHLIYYYLSFTIFYSIYYCSQTQSSSQSQSQSQPSTVTVIVTAVIT